MHLATVAFKCLKYQIDHVTPLTRTDQFFGVRSFSQLISLSNLSADILEEIAK